MRVHRQHDRARLRAEPDLVRHHVRTGRRMGSGVRIGLARTSSERSGDRPSLAGRRWHEKKDPELLPDGAVWGKLRVSAPFDGGHHRLFMIAVLQGNGGGIQMSHHSRQRRKSLPADAKAPMRPSDRSRPAGRA
jgi:hypothetical protein